jgi:hypothetical protein
VIDLDDDHNDHNDKCCPATGQVYSEQTTEKFFMLNDMVAGKSGNARFKSIEVEG